MLCGLAASGKLAAVEVHTPARLRARQRPGSPGPPAIRVKRPRDISVTTL